MPYAGFEKATNCILEIPQNIKMILENNVLTLKAGSILALGNSATYTTYTTTQDYSTTIPNNRPDGTFVITFIVGVGLWDTNIPISETYSSATAPSTTYPHALWFDTTTTKIMNWSNIQNAWQSQVISYPLCNIEVKDGVASFTKDDNGNDIIFNDFSIIGHHYIGYPNDNLALGCDGFNTDGSYKTTYIHRNALYIFELPKTNVTYFLKPNGTLFGGGWDPNSQLPYEEVNELPTTYVAANIYVKDENQVYRWSDGASTYQIQNNSMYYGYINLSSTGIFKSMAIQQPLTKYRWVVKLIP